MRDLKRDFPHLLGTFRRGVTIFSRAYRFPYAPGFERVTYYSGNEFKSMLFKDSMVGHTLFEFARTKITGRSIHLRKKKKKKK